MRLPPESLDAAYRATLYRVELPDGPLDWRIGHADAAADQRLRTLGCQRGWALVSAANPGSQRLDEAANAARLRELQATLQARGQPYYPAVHRDPQGRWPDEASVFLLDPPAGLAEDLGRAWQQNAIVRGQLGAAPELVWLQGPLIA